MTQGKDKHPQKTIPNQKENTTAEKLAAAFKKQNKRNPTLGYDKTRTDTA